MHFCVELVAILKRPNTLANPRTVEPANHEIVTIRIFELVTQQS